MKSIVLRHIKCPMLLEHIDLHRPSEVDVHVQLFLAEDYHIGSGSKHERIDGESIRTSLLRLMMSRDQRREGSTVMEHYMQQIIHDCFNQHSLVQRVKVAMTHRDVGLEYDVLLDQWLNWPENL